MFSVISANTSPDPSLTSIASIASHVTSAPWLTIRSDVTLKGTATLFIWTEWSSKKPRDELVVKTVKPSSLHTTSVGSSVLSFSRALSVWLDKQVKVLCALLPPGIIPSNHLTFSSLAATKFEIKIEIK